MLDIFQVPIMSPCLKQRDVAGHSEAHLESALNLQIPAQPSYHLLVGKVMSNAGFWGSEHVIFGRLRA